MKGLRKPMSSMSVRRIFCACIAIAFYGAAVRAAPDRNSGEEKRPTFELKSIAFKGFDLSNRTADVIAAVEVKNGGGFRLKDVKYRLKLNDREVGEGKVDEDLKLPASGESLIELPFTVDMTSIPGVAWGAITDSFTLRYELEAEFTIPIFGALKHTQKTTFKGDLPLGEAFSSLSTRLKEKIFGKP